MTENTTSQATPTSRSTETTAAVAPITPVNIGVHDVQNATTLLGISITRGTWKPEEVSQVGQVYDRLKAFMDYVQAMAQAESQAKLEASKTAETVEPTTVAETTEGKKKRTKKQK